MKKISNLSHEIQGLILTFCIFQVEVKEVRQNEKQNKRGQ